MEKNLKLFKYVDGGSGDLPFPDKESQITIVDFEYNAKRMGEAPSISTKVMYPSCLDNEWGDNVYTTFNGEKYFVINTPTSKKNTSDVRYEHDITMLSEREILSHVFFYDTVHIKDEQGVNRIVAKGTKFSFMGNLFEFVRRLNLSLQCSKIRYHVVINKVFPSTSEYPKTEDKFVSVTNMYLSQALTELHKLYGIPYYFEGRNICIGFPDKKISIPLKYGFAHSLTSITKSNEKNKTINRITGNGSPDNLPYYYPNKTPKGDVKVIAGSGNKGVKQSDISIKDPVKFAEKFPLGKECVYKKNENKAIFINPFIFNNGTYKGYELNSEFSAQIMNSGKNGSITKKFMIEVDVLEDTNLDINCLFTFSAPIGHKKEIRYTIKKDSELGAVFNNGDKIAKGKHKFYITVMAFVENIFPANVGVKITTAQFDVEFSGIYSKNVWTIDGKNIDLSKYGIEISAVTSPSVGDSFTQEAGEIIPFSDVLMPSVYYRKYERFFNASNDDQNQAFFDEKGNHYAFENEWKENRQQEGFKDFPDIKPSIKYAKNSLQQNIDMFLEFAYDENDNDKYHEEGGVLKWEHPYFFAKLRRTDGANGMKFNLFDSANEKQKMVVSMTKGLCGACNFEVGVGKDTDKNTVQVNRETGALIRDPNTGDVLCGREGQPAQQLQEWQNDTSTNEVWIALKKDINTYGFQVPMPNATQNLRPKSKFYYEGNVKKERPDEEVDRFVILGISLPEAYIRAAELELDRALVKYMYENNAEKFGRDIIISRIFLAQHPEVIRTLNENSILSIEYNGESQPFFVDSYKYKTSGKEILPDISVTISKELVERKNSFQRMIDVLKTEIITETIPNSLDEAGDKKYLKKDADEIINNFIYLLKGVFIGSYQSGQSGAKIDLNGNAEFDSIKVRRQAEVGNITSDGSIEGSFGKGIVVKTDPETGKSKMEIDELLVRAKAIFSEIIIKSMKYAGGNWIFSPAGGTCSKVEEVNNGYKCYISNENKDKSVKNEFEKGDLVLYREFNNIENVDGTKSNRFYWRLCSEVGEDFIILTKTPSASGSDIPQAGDSIITFGNTINQERQNAIIISTYGEDAPSVIQYKGVSSFNIQNKNKVTVISPNGNKFTGDFILKDGRSVISATNDNINIAVRSIQGSGENFYTSKTMISFKDVPIDAQKGVETKSRIVSQDKNGFEILGAKGAVVYMYLMTPFKKKGIYTVSFLSLTRTNATKFSLDVMFGQGLSKKVGDITTGGVGRPDKHSFTFEISEKDGYQDGSPVVLSFYTLGWEYYKFLDFKMEYGANESPWTPSRYDSDKDLLDTGINVEDKKITITANQFEVKDNKGKPIAVFSSYDPVTGLPTISAQNLNIDNIHAENCHFRYGSMSGMLMKEPIEITPTNILDYSQKRPNFNDIVLDFLKVGSLMIFRGNFSSVLQDSYIRIYLPGAANNKTLTLDAFKYIGSQIIFINRSSNDIAVSGATIVNSSHVSPVVFKNHIAAFTSKVIKDPSAGGFFIGWELDYDYEINQAAPLSLL